MKREHMSFNNEQIEAYLQGHLEGADKLAFEHSMAQDPLLKNEVELQRDIIESLQNYRRAQLKSRLNNIEVGGASTGVSSTIKIAASLISIGIIGAGIYYFSALPSLAPKKAPVAITAAEEVAVQESAVIEDVEKGNDFVSAESIETPDKVASSDKPVEQLRAPQHTAVQARSSEIQQEKNISQKATTSEATDKGRIEVLVPEGIIADTDADRLKRDHTVYVPDGAIGESSIGKAEDIDVNISDKNKKELSYQYYSNKLFLFGDFNEKPYELIEINTAARTKQLYLFFDGKYYELKSNQTKITRLKEVKDTSVLKHLSK
jgi:anti-sigma factor RsiW